MEQSLRFLSYNICHGNGMDQTIDLVRTAAVISRQKADCVALQELDNGAARSGGVDQTAELARLTGMFGFFGKAIDLQGGSYGIAILTSNPGKIVLHRQLPGYEMRTIIGVETTTATGTPYRIYCTHFPLERDLRILSAGILCEELLKSPLPSVVLGDFNCSPLSYEWKLIANHLKDANDRRILYTCPADNPTKPIDHGFFHQAEHWKNVEISVIDERVASDHRPILIKASLV